MQFLESVASETTKTRFSKPANNNYCFFKSKSVKVLVFKFFKMAAKNKIQKNAILKNAKAATNR